MLIRPRLFELLLFRSVVSCTIVGDLVCKLTRGERRLNPHESFREVSLCDDKRDKNNDAMRRFAVSQIGIFLTTILE